MSTVTEIKTAIQQLSREELRALCSWLEEWEAQAWDDEIKRDAEAGKFDKLAQKAIADFRAERCKELCDAPT